MCRVSKRGLNTMISFIADSQHQLYPDLSSPWTAIRSLISKFRLFPVPEPAVTEPLLDVVSMNLRKLTWVIASLSWASVISANGSGRWQAPLIGWNKHRNKFEISISHQIQLSHNVVLFTNFPVTVRCLHKASWKKPECDSHID